MIDFTQLYKAMHSTPLEPWLNTLPPQLDSLIFKSKHGDMHKWLDILKSLPTFTNVHSNINKSCITITSDLPLDSNSQQNLEQQLRLFHPWRKGPYSLFNIHIDTEWRSDLKWDRLKNQLSPLQDRTVLDVGCGNGYHCWRMAGEGAKLVIGIDPTLLFIMQFFAIKHYVQHDAIHILPLGIDDMPTKLQAFDSVFSMGVMYHRRSPIDHIHQLKDCLRSGGELILETLVIDGKLGETLLPEDRYAKMRNVWFIPSVLTLESWLQRCGFKNIRLANLCQTTATEQRSTDWMNFESLPDFLNPNNINLTIEGYDAPKRAIFIASKP